jgi:AraC-like DNA-binding protein
MPPEGFAPLRVSTAALPTRDRLPFWREVFGRQYCSLDIEPLSNAPFEAEASLRAMPGLSTMECRIVPTRQQRTPEFLADGDDSICLPMSLSGSMMFSQRGREVSLDAGEAVIVLHAEPAVMTNSQVHAIGLVVSRQALSPLVASVEDTAMQVIPRDSEGLRLLTGYVRMLHEGLPLATTEARQLVAAHVTDLVAMAIGATRDGAAIAAERGVRAARLAAIKADIAARLDRRDLGLTGVAARQHVTPRYVQMLFESEGVTFSQFVLEQRLARAYQMLTSPRHAGWAIGTIALAAGFGDLSHFNRRFRRRYGATPSEVRVETLRRGEA